MKIVYCVAVTLLLFLILTPSRTFAVGVELIAPSQISDQPFNVSATIVGASLGQNYVRVDLFKDGTTEYFGETFNGSSWVGGSDGKMYFPVLIASSQAQVTIQARIGNPSNVKYQGSGLYKLRVRRYTASGSMAANDTYTPVDISINYSLPTLTPTQSAPTNSPRTVTLAPTKESAPQPAITVTAEEIEDSDGDTRSYPTAVLGMHQERYQKVTPTKPSPVVSGDNKNDLLPIIFLLAGGGFIASCGILMYRNWRLKGI